MQTRSPLPYISSFISKLLPCMMLLVSTSWANPHYPLPPRHRYHYYHHLPKLTTTAVIAGMGIRMTEAYPINNTTTYTYIPYPAYVTYPTYTVYLANDITARYDDSTTPSSSNTYDYVNNPRYYKTTSIGENTPIHTSNPSRPDHDLASVIPAPINSAQAYWYYCRSYHSYYPHIEYCPENWEKVLPMPPPLTK